jgi:hypothetical protein
MNKAFRTFCVISLMMAGPSIVAAQSSTAFDGTYEGVSANASVCTPLDNIPRPLTIHNGIARLTSGSQASGPLVFEGNVSPQGELKMWDMFGRNLIAKIDPSGKVAGSVNIADSGCVYTVVWQKK